MDAAVFFYISAGVAMWVFVATVLLIGIQIYITLTKVQKAIESTKNFAEGLKNNQLSSMFGFFSIAKRVLKKFKSFGGGTK